MSRNYKTDIFVGNLPRHSISQRKLADVFKRFGPILKVELRGPSGSMTSKPFGFIEFEDPRDAEDAVHAREGNYLDGHHLRVEYAVGHQWGQQQHRGRHAWSRGYRGGGRGRSSSRPSIGNRNKHRILIKGLPASTTWQYLKDYVRGKMGHGSVTYANINESGNAIVQFLVEEDVKRAIMKLDNSEFRGINGDTAIVQVMCVHRDSDSEYEYHHHRSRSPQDRRHYSSEEEGGRHSSRRDPSTKDNTEDSKKSPSGQDKSTGEEAKKPLSSQDKSTKSKNKKKSTLVQDKSTAEVGKKSSGQDKSNAEDGKKSSSSQDKPNVEDGKKLPSRDKSTKSEKAKKSSSTKEDNSTKTDEGRKKSSKSTKDVEDGPRRPRPRSPAQKSGSRSRSPHGPRQRHRSRSRSRSSSRSSAGSSRFESRRSWFRAQTKN